LYVDGKAEAAVEMERRWDELARVYDVDILCGYPWIPSAAKRNVLSSEESAQSTQPLTFGKTRLPAGDRLN
jgi:hypothetical protein